MPFRKLDFEQRYKKYSWVELDVEKNTSDFRMESYRPLNLDTLTITAESKQRRIDWQQRKDIVFRNKKIYANLNELIAKAKSDMTSLAVFKPTKITGFQVEPTTREWDKNKLALLEAESRQFSLFQTPEDIQREFKTVKKVPYKFSYTFEDDSGKSSTLMIEDWEIGMLYFNCVHHANGDEKIANAKVREKYGDELTKKDLYFFLGTTKQHHMVSPNPFIIIGVFYPPLISGLKTANLPTF
jgi:hypothetical protein